MSENEKLRSLLAEAREALATDDVGVAFRAAQRIDAALAEPVEPPSEGAVRFGCGDNSCIFKVLAPGGMGTNGGCRCFKDLESWLDGEKRWNRPEVRRVEQAARMLSQRVHTAERERDEARAEVERLTAALWAVRRAWSGRDASCDWGLHSAIEGDAADALYGGNAASANVERAIAKAYQRGAEAMREAAADYVDWYEWKDRQRAKTCADAIRALPIPEDKP